MESKRKNEKTETDLEVTQRPELAKREAVK